MSSYKDTMSDEAIPITVMFLTAFIGLLSGVHYLNQQWTFLSGMLTPEVFLATIAAVGIVIGIVAVVKGFFLFGMTALLTLIFVAATTMISPAFGLLTDDLVYVGFALMFIFMAIMCFIGGEFDALVFNVCFAVAVVLLISTIDFEYKEGITGVFFIIAGAAALYSSLKDWNLVMGGRSRPRRKEEYYDDDDDADDDADDEFDDNSRDEFDEYDAPRR